MGHIPHVFVPAPWESDTLKLEPATMHHLERVLRRRDGDPVTYTDGAGTTGSGIFTRSGIERGVEHAAPAAPSRLTIAAAPPHGADRARFLVEKLAELGVDELSWLETEHGTGRPPNRDKALAWSISALQQSRGHRLLDISGPRTTVGPWEQGASVFVADPAGDPLAGGSSAANAVVLIGPEGGFADGEVPPSTVPISLGPRILRVETAAIVAATLFLNR